MPPPSTLSIDASRLNLSHSVVQKICKSLQYSTHRRGQDRKIFVCTLLQELEILIWMTAGAGDGHGLVNAHGNDDSGLFQGCYI